MSGERTAAELMYDAGEMTAEEFFADYRPEMAAWTDDTSSNALSGAIVNPDLEARVLISNRLLDDGADAAVQSSDGTNLLHQLFFDRDHDFEAEAILLRRLFEGGADINGYSPKWGRPLHVLVDNYGIGDEELGPFYDVIFAQPGIDWDAPVSLKSADEKRTLRDLVEASADTHPEMLRRMREYLATGPASLP